MDSVADETYKIYEAIIQEVISKLKKNSDRGQLQMSESDIQVFKDHWMDYLKKIREGGAALPNVQVQAQSKIIQMEDEPPITKKVKPNQEEAEVKKEEDEDEDEQADLEFEEDSKSSSVKQEQHIENEQEDAEQREKREEFERRRNESQRDKTLFDKIRDLANIKNEIKTEEQDGDDEDSDEPKTFEGYIYAQKINNETVVSRIRPNKLQKASLENVLIKDKNNKDLFYAAATLQFNFRTNKKKSNQ